MAGLVLTDSHVHTTVPRASGCGAVLGLGNVPVGMALNGLAEQHVAHAFGGTGNRATTRVSGHTPQQVRAAAGHLSHGLANCCACVLSSYFACTLA
jgi:hypothetical protein